MASKLATLGNTIVKGTIKVGKPVLANVIKYGKVELTPPRLSDIPQIRAGINNILSGYRTGRWKQITVREAWLNTLVTAEVLCWFFVGECIGKWKLIGYDV